MKTGRTLQELAAEIERRKETKKDYILPARALSMTTVGQRFDQKRAEPGFWLDDIHYSVTNQAHAQIADYLKIPMAYYRRMLAEAPELLARNVNQWLAELKDDKLCMVRCMDGKVRALAIASFENEDFCEAVARRYDNNDLKRDSS